MNQKYKVQLFQDDIYEVLELDDSLDEFYRPFQGYEKVFQGSLADCEAFIRLREQGYM